MRDRLLALLGVEPGEESMVSILLTQSVFLGIFLGTFDISAHSLFLSIFDEKMMAKGYVVSGFAGIILTSLYTTLQTRLKFRNFSVANLVFVTAFTLVLWIAVNMTQSKWIVFFVFIMLGPLNILAALGFWGTAGRLFSLRQGKRLFGLVDSGLILGIIISSYTIPVILSLNFSSHNILLISAISIFVAGIIQVMIGSRFRLVAEGAGESSGKKEAKKESVISVLRKDRYITVMAIFVALSVMTAFFVQYSFMAVTREQYPSEEDMARFLGIFTGSMMIFTLLIKLLVFSYLIRNYGLKLCLAVPSLLIVLMTTIAVLLGLTMGYTPESASGFLLFFLVLALSRLFSKSVKDSIESPSFKVIYQTIDEKIRYEVQSAMDGTVNEIAALSSGLILAGLGMLSFIKLIHFSFVLFVIILIWIFVSWLLYKEYRKSIRKALESTTTGEREASDVKKTAENSFTAALAFKSDYFRLIAGDYSPLEAGHGRKYVEKIADKGIRENDLSLLPVLRKIRDDNRSDAAMREICEKAVIELERHRVADGKRKAAMVTLAGTTAPQTTEVLRLLRDNSTDSKRLGIFIIGKFRLAEMITEVCDCLVIPELETDAISVLTYFGPDAVRDLERFFMANSGNVCAGKHVLRIMSSIRSAESFAFLFSRLWSISRETREMAVSGLLEGGYNAEGENRDRLHQLISDKIGILTWNISARVTLAKHEDTILLKILDKDTDRWRKFLFNLLSIAYDRSSIEKIKENLDKDTVESVNFALEMIDIVIEDSIKPKIIALFDMVSDEDRLKNLWHFFPGEISPYDRLLENIINRDYNLVTVWTKACTLRHIDRINGNDLAETASALLFSPDCLMQEEAAGLLARCNKDVYTSVSGRIPVFIRERLDGITKGKIEPGDLMFEKIHFLTQRFKNVPEEKLILLAEKLRFIENPGTGSQSPGECIIWQVKAEAGENQVNLIYGMGEQFRAEGLFYFLPLAAVEKFLMDNPGLSSEVMSYFEQIESD
jgi:ATP/ADP translocase